MIMEKNYNINDQLDGTETSSCFHFYDWFCKDKSLEAKAKSLTRKVVKFCEAAKIDKDKHYFFFKNNCPCFGSLYDDFRICDKETGDVVWTVVPKSGHRVDNGNGSLWGKVNGFSGPVKVGTFKEILEYIKSI